MKQSFDITLRVTVEVISPNDTKGDYPALKVARDFFEAGGNQITLAPVHGNVVRADVSISNSGEMEVAGSSDGRTSSSLNDMRTIKLPSSDAPKVRQQRRHDRPKPRVLEDGRYECVVCKRGYAGSSMKGGRCSTCRAMKRDIPLPGETVNCDPKAQDTDDVAKALPDTLAAVWDAICENVKVDGEFLTGDVMAWADVDLVIAGIRTMRLSNMGLITVLERREGHLQKWRRIK